MILLKKKLRLYFPVVLLHSVKSKQKNVLLYNFTYNCFVSPIVFEIFVTVAKIMLYILYTSLVVESRTFSYLLKNS